MSQSCVNDQLSFKLSPEWIKRIDKLVAGGGAYKTREDFVLAAIKWHLRELVKISSKLN